jgi:hypothetical protein
MICNHCSIVPPEFYTVENRMLEEEVARRLYKNSAGHGEQASSDHRGIQAWAAALIAG